VCKSKRVQTNKVAFIQVLDLRLQLIAIILDLLESKILVPKEPSLTILVGDWEDGSTVMTWSVIALLAGILFDTKLFSDEKRFNTVTKMKPIIMGIFPETTKSVIEVRRIFAAMIKRLRPPFVHDNVCYFFRMRIAKADISMMNKLFGNNCSGYKRCFCCDASFKHPRNLFSYRYCQSCCQKTLSNIATITAQNPERAKQMGLHDYLPLLPERNLMLSTMDNLKHAGLEHYEQGLDALHLIKGFLEKVLFLESKRKDWDRKKFACLLLEQMSRDSVAKLKGREFRLLFLNYRKLILPCMGTPTHCASFKIWCELWLEIQFIMYALPSFRKVPAFRLHLHVAGFLLLRYSRILWGIEIMCMYLHTIAIHSPTFYEKMDFRNANCEQGEAFFS